MVIVWTLLKRNEGQQGSMVVGGHFNDISFDFVEYPWMKDQVEPAKSFWIL